MAALSRALELGEPEGYVRTFTGEGPAMAPLLTAAAKRGVAPSYAARLLGSTDPAPPEPARQTPWSTRSATASSTCCASWPAS